MDGSTFLIRNNASKKMWSNIFKVSIVSQMKTGIVNSIQAFWGWETEKILFS